MQRRRRGGDAHHSATLLTCTAQVGSESALEGSGWRPKARAGPVVAPAIMMAAASVSLPADAAWHAVVAAPPEVLAALPCLVRKCRPRAAEPGPTPVKELQAELRTLAVDMLARQVQCYARSQASVG